MPCPPFQFRHRPSGLDSSFSLAPLLLATFFWLLYIAASFAASAKPNVIMVLTDDQGYGDLACHGNPELKTPNLDKLHAESIRFTDFHAAPMCTATRGQLISGRQCLANGAMNPSSGRTAGMTNREARNGTTPR